MPCSVKSFRDIWLNYTCATTIALLPQICRGIDWKCTSNWIAKVIIDGPINQGGQPKFSQNVEQEEKDQSHCWQRCKESDVKDCGKGCKVDEVFD